MKISFSLFCLLAIGSAAAHTDESNSSMLRRTQVNKPRRKSKKACITLLTHKQYADKHSEDLPLVCELQSDDLIGGVKYSTVKVKGLTNSWARHNKIISGVSTLFVPNSEIDDNSRELILPIGASLDIGRFNQMASGSTLKSGLTISDPSDSLLWNRKLQTVGSRRVLVLRIQAADRSTTASESMLSDDIFGATGDPVNMISQFSQCSYGQLQFEPATHPLVGSDGVYTVVLPTTNVVGASDSTIASAAINKATADLGSLTSLANHVLVCIPPGTTGGWIAWAYVNHWMSVYNDKWCGYPSANLHEVGHNLNLAHSGEGASEYGDQSGMMGSSYSLDDGPVMCYNGPKTWQLGWFRGYHIEPIINSINVTWTGDLVGFAERANALQSDKMIVRLKGVGRDVYINFNRMLGINSGTREGGNQILVTSRSSGEGYAPSLLDAKLSSGGVYGVPNFNGTSNTLIITVNSLNTTTIPARATVSITLVSQTAAPTGAPITVAPTRMPTAAPTRTPTRKPTAAPTRTPTRKPTVAPTRTPTRTPTAATGAPTRTPTRTPTAATAAPTAAPTTAAPTADPTAAPITAAPTADPTAAPTADPTTAAPTADPTADPTTAAPTADPTTAAPITAAPTADPTTAPTEALPTE